MRIVRSLLFIVAIIGATGAANFAGAQDQTNNFLEYWAIQANDTTVNLGFRWPTARFYDTLSVKTACGFGFKDVKANSISVEKGIFVLRYNKSPNDCTILSDTEKIAAEFYALTPINAVGMRKEMVARNTGPSRHTSLVCHSGAE